MGLFDRIRRKTGGKDAANRQPRSEDVWELSDRTAFLIAMSEKLCGKCGNGERLSALSPEERTACAVDAFQREVNNGGFEQYLYNSSGAMAGELLDALHAVGADCVAEIYRPALAALPGKLPADEEERGALLDEALTESVSERLDRCDGRFYERSGDLEERLYRYIVENWGSFE